VLRAFPVAVGGLLFGTFALVVSLALCVCAPLGGAIALYVYRSIRRQDDLKAKRDRQIDDMLLRKREKRTAPRATMEPWETKSLLE
jgi:hypothetical protein